MERCQYQNINKESQLFMDICFDDSGLDSITI